MIWHCGRWACGYCDGLLCPTEDDGVACLICGRDVLMTSMAAHLRLRTLIDDVAAMDRARPIGPGRPTIAAVRASATKAAPGKPRERSLAAVMESLGTFTADDIEQAFPSLQRITVQGYCRVMELRGVITRIRTAQRMKDDRTVYRWVGHDAACVD